MYLPSKSLLFREYPRGFHTSCEAFIKSAFLAIFSGFQINHANPAFPANVLFRILVLKKINQKLIFFFQKFSLLTYEMSQGGNFNFFRTCIDLLKNARQLKHVVAP